MFKLFKTKQQEKKFYSVYRRYLLNKLREIPASILVEKISYQLSLKTRFTYDEIFDAVSSAIGDFELVLNDTTELRVKEIKEAISIIKVEEDKFN